MMFDNGDPPLFFGGYRGRVNPKLAEHSAALGKRIAPQALNDVEGERDYEDWIVKVTMPPILIPRS